MLTAYHGAGERVAYAHGKRGRRRLVFLHHVEMGVESRDLVDLGERERHLLRQRGEMRGGEITVAVLDQVQMLDQEIAPALALAQQRAHLGQRLRLDLPALGRLAWPVAPSQSSAIVGARVHVGILLNRDSPDDVDGRRFLNWLEAEMREGGWLSTFPTVRAVFDCLIWPFSLAFGRTPFVGCSRMQDIERLALALVVAAAVAPRSAAKSPG